MELSGGHPDLEEQGGRHFFARAVEGVRTRFASEWKESLPMLTEAAGEEGNCGDCQKEDDRGLRDGGEV